jgi:hypothetical protein
MMNKKHTGIAGRIIVALLSLQSIVPAFAISRDPYYQEMNNAGTPTADA